MVPSNSAEGTAQGNPHTEWLVSHRFQKHKYGYWGGGSWGGGKQPYSENGCWEREDVERNISSSPAD